MFEILLILTALVIGVAMFEGYLRTGDALMPMIVFGPMLAFAYVYNPAMLLYHGELERFFPDLAQLEYVALVNLVGVGLFCFGCVSAIASGFGAAYNGEEFSNRSNWMSARGRGCSIWHVFSE